MNENAQKWVEALESGRFRQGPRALSRDGKYCCLGVACAIYQEEVGDLRIVTDDNGRVYYDADAATLPDKVREWLGLYSPQGGYGIDVNNRIRRRDALTADNDAGATFKEIAATIRSEPPGLFDEAPTTD